MVRVFAFAASAFACLIVGGQAFKATSLDPNDFVIDIESEGKALGWRLDECPPGQNGCDIGSGESPNQYMRSNFDGKIKNIRVRPRGQRKSPYKYRGDDGKPGFIVTCRSEGRRRSEVEAKVYSDGKDGSVIFSCGDNEADQKSQDPVSKLDDETFTFTTAFEPQGTIMVDGSTVGFKIKGLKEVEHRFNENSPVADGSILKYTARLNGYKVQNGKPIMFYDKSEKDKSEKGQGNAKSITVVTGGTYARSHGSRPRNRYNLRNNEETTAEIDAKMRNNEETTADNTKQLKIDVNLRNNEEITADNTEQLTKKKKKPFHDYTGSDMDDVILDFQSDW